MTEQWHQPGESPRDWTEDFDHENGEYLNRCQDCGGDFYGHKRRRECKECTTRNLALEGIDRAAQADDLLKPRDDISEYVQRADIAAERAIERRKAILDRTPEQQPTEESVREIARWLRRTPDLVMQFDALHQIRFSSAATLLETLLAENKMLREREATITQIAYDKGRVDALPSGHVVVEVNQYELLREEALSPHYNPATYVAVRREPTDAVLARGISQYENSTGGDRLPDADGSDYNIMRDIYKAMLTAAQEGE
jgi:hypothetical protein